MARWGVVALVVAVGAVTARADNEWLQIPRPSLGNLEASTRQQIESKRAALDQELAQGDSTGQGLSTVFGEMGTLYYVHDFSTSAEACFLNALLIAPEEFRWHYYLGALYPGQGEREKAATSLERAVELKPDDLAARIRLGRVELGLNRLEEAKVSFAAALEIDASSAAAHYGLGQVAVQQTSYTEAIEHFKTAVERQPEATLIYYQMGLAYREIGELDEALAAMQQNTGEAVRFEDPLVDNLFTLVDSAKLHFNSAIDLLDAGEMDLAIIQLEMAIEKNPEYLLAHHNLAAVYIMQGRLEEGIAGYRRTLEVNPDYRNAHFNLAVALADKGDLNEAAVHFERAYELDPEDQMAHLEWATALSQLGRTEQAEAELLSILELEPRNTRAMLNLGSVQAKLGRYEEAVATFDRLLEIGGNPEAMARAYQRRAGALQQLGRIEEAREDFQTALQIDPEITEAHIGLANLEGQRGIFAAAATHYDAAVRIAPEDLNSHFGRALAFILAEQYLAARDALEESIGMHTDSVPLLHLLARLLATAPADQVRDGERAVDLAQRVFSAQQNLTHAETIAMAMAEVGRFTEAIDWQNQVLGRAQGSPPEAQAAMRQRLALYQQGEPCRAPWQEEK